MAEINTINTGEMAVGHNDMHIKTGSIGSCVVITLYDDEAGVGGMAHAMLPTRRKVSPDAALETEKDIIESEAAAKYVDEAIDRLVASIEKKGGKKERLKAKLIGGARMFKVLSGDKHGIGYQNVEAAKAKLEVLEIVIESEDTGGTIGRIAEMNLANGLVEVSTKM